VSDSRVAVVAAALVGHDFQQHSGDPRNPERACLCGAQVWDVYTWRLHRAEVILAALDAA
jgi:hypothetical protein